MPFAPTLHAGLRLFLQDARHCITGTGGLEGHWRRHRPEGLTSARLRLLTACIQNDGMYVAGRGPGGEAAGRGRTGPAKGKAARQCREKARSCCNRLSRPAPAALFLASANILYCTASQPSLTKVFRFKDGRQGSSIYYVAGDVMNTLLCGKLFAGELQRLPHSKVFVTSPGTYSIRMSPKILKSPF